MNVLSKYRNIPVLLLLLATATITSCTKVIDINIPDSARQVVVEGTIENDVPPVVILTKSSKFFDNVNINDIGSYFVHGATVHVSASDGTQTELVELCLQNLNLPPEQQEIVLNAFGFTSIDSAQIPNVCVYTVPDIATYFTTGSCSFMGKERTTYNLDVMSPPLNDGQDSIHVTASTSITTVIGIDSLTTRPHPNPQYADSMVAVYAYFSVPDTFGNFVRYWTKRNNEPFYTPIGGSVYDDKLFVGLSIGLPVERGQRKGADFNINTDSYFWKGDTVTVKWGNIDNKTYDFFYTLENDGGDSPFSSPVKIKSNISNGLGIWAGYASSYGTIIIPK
ncbi:MAG: DUF4249 family protein [Chitinophagales bacterium]